MVLSKLEMIQENKTENILPVFFNLGSAEPRGSAKIFLGSANYLTISSFAFIYSADHLKKYLSKQRYLTIEPKGLS